ncbi:MAG: hypothetical protein ACM362_10615 [Candidatus Methylomirabilota bacterium]
MTFETSFDTGETDVREVEETGAAEAAEAPSVTSPKSPLALTVARARRIAHRAVYSHLAGHLDEVRALIPPEFAGSSDVIMAAVDELVAVHSVKSI